MKTKSKKIVKKTTIDPIFDLFGDVIVTYFDVYMWVAVITHGRFLGNANRYHYYVENWNVAYKVKQYKQRGLFKTIESDFIANFEGISWLPPHLQ
jgi:hypothetical protein